MSLDRSRREVKNDGDYSIYVLGVREINVCYGKTKMPPGVEVLSEEG